MDSPDPVNATSPKVSGPADDETSRVCVACGYSLYGLGEEPRCPECGLVNIPEAFRKQVWELIDSRRWFFSTMFNPFAKRLPGWWWALDRPGDVRRSFKFAAVHILASALLIFAFAAIADSIVIQETFTCVYPDPSKPAPALLSAGEEISWLRWGGRYGDDQGNVDWDTWLSSPAPSIVRSTAIGWRPSATFLGPALGLVLALWMVWFLPAAVGLYTQIRKGLPSFARAPRTIMAACNYETHRLVYLALFFGFAAIGDFLLRHLFSQSPRLWEVDGVLFFPLFALMGLLAALSWVGPLRSDYTHQLVRSRRHAARIIIWYAVCLPALTSFTVTMAFIALRLP